MKSYELYECCRNLSDDIQSSAKVVVFNPRLCEHLARQYSASFEQLDVASSGSESSCAWVPDCEPALNELRRLMLDGRRLVEACKREDWWKRAIVYADDAAFDERIYCHLLHFLGCVYSLKVALAEATSGQLIFSAEPPTVWRDYIKEIGKEDLDILKRKVTEKIGRKDSDYQLAFFLHAKLTSAQPGTMDTDFIEFPDSSVKDLGQGAYGRVQKCLWHGEVVAVKSMLLSGDRTTLRKEVQVLDGLAHPNVVQMVGFGLGDDKDLLVMEPMAKDLSSWMKEFSDPPPWFITIDTILQIAQGVQYLHSPKAPPKTKVIHRDLKPTNVLLTKVCKSERAESAGHVRVKVADFGMSKTKDQISRFATTGVGSPMYTAPEILRLRTTDDALRTDELYTWSADVWSFAITTSEILTGKVPFQSPSQLLKRLVVNGERPTLPSDIPPYFSALIEKCWNVNPRERPSFDVICDMLLFCKNAFLRGPMPSKFASINEYNARMFIKHLGLDWCLHEGSLHHGLISLETYFKVLNQSGEGESLQTNPLLVAKGYGDWTSPHQDLTRAVRLFEFAAETLKDPEALWRLGLSFELGLGTEVNMAKAITNYQAASNLGFVPADVELGLSYALGRGVAVDLNAAAKHWKKAIEREGVMGEQALDSIRELIQHTIKWLGTDGGNTSESAVTREGGKRALQRLVEIASLLPEGRHLVAGHSCCNIPDLVNADKKSTCSLLQNLLNNLSKDEEIKKSILSLKPISPLWTWLQGLWPRD